MNIRNRFIIMTSVIGILGILIISLALRAVIVQSVLMGEQEHFADLGDLAAERLENDLYAMIRTVRTLSGSELIGESLADSNLLYDEMSKEERDERLEHLDSAWRLENEISSDQIVAMMQQPLSVYLKSHQKALNGWYGEIFVVNRHGLAIGMTNPLRKLNYQDKYWFESAHNHGVGKVFIGDNGYDHTIDAYVLSIVVPVYGDGQVEGLLKAHISISDLLKDSVEDISELHETMEMVVMRSDGRVVNDAGESIQYLELVDLDEDVLNQNSVVTSFDKNWLYVGVPVRLTYDPEGFSFGFNSHSLDYKLGDIQEGWHIVLRIERSEILQEINQITKSMIVIDLVIIALIIVSGAVMIVRSLRPMQDLVEGVMIIGEGNLDYQVRVDSDDELGELGNAINEMTAHLKETTISKKKLEEEVLQRIKVEKELYRLSTTDELTQISNRRAFNEFVEEAISRNTRYGETFSLLMLDIDYFKSINDKYGHGVGDQVLIALSGFFQSSIRLADRVARWGGEEFVILMPQVDAHEAYQAAQRLRKDAEQKRFASISGIRISIGVTEFRQGDNIDTLIARVDDALYEAKKTGRNKAVMR